MAKIRCVYKMPGGPAHIGEIPNELKDFQFFVDGCIETVPLSCGAVLVCNEEAKMNGAHMNFFLRNKQTDELWDFVCGPVVIVGTDGEEFESLQEDLALQICEALNRLPELEVG